MNTVTIETPPVNTSCQAAPPALVGLHIGVGPLSALYADFIPVNMPTASLMLARVLTLQLKMDALLDDEEVVIFGGLADAVALIRTRNARQTAATIQAELDRLALIAICQIGIRTAAAWECVYPSADIDMAPLLDTARLVEFHKKHSEMTMARLAALKAIFHRPPGPLDPPPPAAK